MKIKIAVIIIIFIFLFKIANANELIIDIRGYYKNEEIVMANKSKLIHYQSKGNWSDNKNNYGKFKCKGSIFINESGKRSDKELTLCELEDVNGEFMWLNSKRSESEWQAGVGQSKIISTTKKYKKLINKICIYAVTYYKDSFHTKTKCQN